MRTPLIVANWKMNHSVEESIAFSLHFQRETLPRNVEIVIAPPFTSLYSLSVILNEKSKAVILELGAQNCHHEERGAFTGEISPVFLAELGCRFVILGHSERRQLFGETNDSLAKKIPAVLAHRMTPLFCVGETLEERESGQTQNVILKQLSEGLSSLFPKDLSLITIAYEPVWAIGTGKTATPEQAQEVHLSIRNWLTGKAGADVADKIRLLYGGSVNVKNIASLMAMPDIDGALVGGASLKAKDFAELIRLSV